MPLVPPTPKVQAKKTTPKTPKKAAPEPWLLALLETKTGGFRHAKWTRCPTCNQPTLKGINNDQCAWTVTADPTPLNPQQELQCILAGRETYSATPHGKTYDLHHRDENLISSYPPGTPTTYGTVLPQHQCHNTYPTHLPHTHTPPYNTTPNF